MDSADKGHEGNGSSSTGQRITISQNVLISMLMTSLGFDTDEIVRAYLFVLMKGEVEGGGSRMVLRVVDDQMRVTDSTIGEVRQVIQSIHSLVENGDISRNQESE